LCPIVTHYGVRHRVGAVIAKRIHSPVAHVINIVAMASDYQILTVTT